MEATMVTGNIPRDVSIAPEKGSPESDLSSLRDLDRSARRWFVASVLIGAVLAIVLHAVVGSVVVVANELEFGPLGRTFGAEVVASVWALLAFAASAWVFYRFHRGIRGVGWERGLRYGGAIGLLWLVGMLEGVALFGNPLHAEFLVGLSDAIPVLLMSILLAVFVLKPNVIRPDHSARLRTVPVLLTISVMFVIGRYIAYLSGIIGSGHSEYPAATFVWTLGMGMSAGIAFLLLWNAVMSSSIRRTAATFGLWIFGVNWFVFMLFIPMLFEGTFVDVMLRVTIDIVAVGLGSYLALWLWQRSSSDHPVASPGSG
jgi:hypothetical protein